MLASIRNTGGKNLKKAAERVLSKASSQPQAPPKQMTMFEQLQASMNRRQEAISGKQDRREKKRDTIALMQNPDTFRNNIRTSLTASDDCKLSDSEEESDVSVRNRVFSDESMREEEEDETEEPMKPKLEVVEKAKEKTQVVENGVDSRKGSLWDHGSKDLARMLKHRQVQHRAGRKVA